MKHFKKKKKKKKKLYFQLAHIVMDYFHRDPLLWSNFDFKQKFDFILRENVD